MNNTKATFIAGGSPDTIAIDIVTIATTGNATDHGDLNTTGAGNRQTGSCSGSAS